MKTMYFTAMNAFLGKKSFLLLLTISIGTLLSGVGAWATESQPPLALPGTLDAVQNTPTNGMLHGTSPESVLIFHLSGTPPAKGAVDITNAATGDYTYTPKTGAIGTDSFQFTISNSAGLTSEPATITITIHPAPIDLNQPLSPDNSSSSSENQQIRTQIRLSNPNPDPYGLSFSFNVSPPINTDIATVSLNIATTGDYLVNIYNDTLDVEEDGVTPARTRIVGSCGFADGGPYTNTGVQIDDMNCGTGKFTFTAVLYDGDGNPLGEECSTLEYSVFLSLYNELNQDTYIGVGDQLNTIECVHIEPTALLTDFNVTLSRNSNSFDLTTVHFGETPWVYVHPDMNTVPLLFNGANSINLTPDMDQTRDWLGNPCTAVFDLQTWPVGLQGGSGNLTLTFTANNVPEFSQSVNINVGTVVIQPGNWTGNNISGTNNYVRFYAMGLEPNTNYMVTPMFKGIPIWMGNTYYQVNSDPTAYWPTWPASPYGPMYLLTDGQGNWSDVTHQGYCYFDATALQYDGQSGNFNLQLSNMSSTVNSNAIASTTIYNKAYLLGNQTLSYAKISPANIANDINFVNYSNLQNIAHNKDTILRILPSMDCFFISTHGDIDAIAPHGTQKFADCFTHNSTGNWISALDLAGLTNDKLTNSLPQYSIVEISGCKSAGKWTRQWYKDDIVYYRNGPLVLNSVNYRIPISDNDLAYNFGIDGTINRAYVGFIDIQADCQNTNDWDNELWNMLSMGSTIEEAFSIANATYPYASDTHGFKCLPKFFGDPNARLHSVYR